MDLEKAEESKIKLPTSAGSLEKQEFQKNIHFCFTDYAKVFGGSQQTVKNSSRDGNTEGGNRQSWTPS